MNSIFREKGLENLVYEKDDMNPRTNIYHAVEILLSKVDKIQEQKKNSIYQESKLQPIMLAITIKFSISMSSETLKTPS